MDLLEVDNTYRINVNIQDDRRWKLPTWAEEHNKYLIMENDVKTTLESPPVWSPFKAIIKKITTDGIWVKLYIDTEIQPRSGLMQLFWKDILTIEVE